MERWTMYCDHPDCRAFVTEERKAGSALFAVLTSAQIGGWSIEGRLHLCPTHKEKR